MCKYCDDGGPYSEVHVFPYEVKMSDKTTVELANADDNDD